MRGREERVTGAAATRLVQLRRGSTRRVARVEEPSLRLLDGADTVLALAETAIASGVSLTALVEQRATPELLDYDPVYAGSSPWRLLVPIDHPEPARCLVSGTGLTHLGSAENRAKMHGKSESDLTDSMRMFRLGIVGGRPEPNRCGAAPEWFYKGNGAVLRAHGEELVVPGYAEDGGEEAEVAGVYVIDSTGRPHRIGMAAGNEFSDHKFEKHNYLHLAGLSRTCALGPELVVDPDLRARRAGWRSAGWLDFLGAGNCSSGEREMCHSVANIEHHHFKFEAHRRPGDVHVHYYGAHSLSFADEVLLAEGDVMSIQFGGFGARCGTP